MYLNSFSRISQSLRVGLRKKAAQRVAQITRWQLMESLVLPRMHREPCPVLTQQSEPSSAFSRSWIVSFMGLPALCLVLDNTGKVIYYKHAMEIQGQDVKMKQGCIFQIEVRVFIIDDLIFSRCLLFVFFYDKGVLFVFFFIIIYFTYTKTFL